MGGRWLKKITSAGKVCNHCTLFPTDSFYGEAKYGAFWLRTLCLFQLFAVLKGVADFSRPKQGSRCAQGRR